MSEFLFGVSRGRITAAEVRHRDRICVEEGGHGYTQIREPGGEYRGWYFAANKGDPFDRDLAARVLLRVTVKDAK